MTKLTFTFWDWIPAVIYLLFLLYIGFRSKSNIGSETGFILSGRRLTLPSFVATLVATWYGGILGVGEYSFKYGISNWIAFGLPYYVFAVLFALFLVPAVKKEKLITLPEIFRKRYGNNISLLAAFLVYLITNPAPYLFMAAVLLQLFVPWPLWIALLTVMFFSSFYLLEGGFGAVVKTDILQFVVMFVGFFVIIPFSYFRLGDFTSMVHRLPETHLTATGGNSWMYVMIWFWLALVTLIDPNFYQRVFAADSVKTARKGILTAVVFWFVFDIMTTLAGLYAAAFLTLEQPYYAYPALADKVLPPLFKGLFTVSLLATVMSSLDSFTFSSSVTLSRDILSVKFKQKQFADYYLPALFITLFFAFAMSLLFPSVIDLWYVIANVAVPPLIFPILILYWTSYRPAANIVVAAMGLSFLLAGTDLIMARIAGYSGSFLFPGYDPIYIGLLINLFIYGADRLRLKYKIMINQNNDKSERLKKL